MATLECPGNGASYSGAASASDNGQCTASRSRRSSTGYAPSAAAIAPAERPAVPTGRPGPDGAIRRDSASGCSTKARSCIRGCGRIGGRPAGRDLAIEIKQIEVERARGVGHAVAAEAPPRRAAARPAARRPAGPSRPAATPLTYQAGPRPGPAPSDTRARPRSGRTPRRRARQRRLERLAGRAAAIVGRLAPNADE